MKKLIYIIFAFLPVMVMAQDENTFSYRGLLRASASFGIGSMTHQNLKNAYMNGDMEYYINNRVSVRGEAYYFFNSLNNENSPLLMNHQLFSGASYHFRPDKRLDFYVGFQPGIAYSQTRFTDTCPECVEENQKSNATFNPLYSGLVGMNYYATKFFHLFISARYLSGKHLSNAPEPLRLDEFRFSFGLGFNVHVLESE